MTKLVTERLVLRRARESDLADLHDAMRRPEAMRYWSTPEHETLEETRVWLQRMLHPAHPADDFVITLDGRVIGKAGSWKLPEVGYLIHPDHWGQGYAAEAMRAVIAHLFATHDMDRLVAEVDPRNAASLKLLAKLGFVETHREARTLQWRDEWCDSVYLALPRPG
jgi:RimJ/RimL family protein N-acetyltransferase